jgi:hypothetical protein
MNKKKERLEKRKLSNLLKENKIRNRKLRGINNRRKLILSSEESENDEVPNVDTSNEESSYNEECIFCQELYSYDKNGESWIRCIQWAGGLTNFVQELNVGKHLLASFAENLFHKLIFMLFHYFMYFILRLNILFSDRG